jgi:peptide subunit release factor 1 (eRF1)
MPVITETAIRELAAFRSSGSPVVSCYLDVDGRRQVRPQDYEHRLDALLRQAAGRDLRASQADLDVITTYVRNGFDRSGVRGLAMFSCVEQRFWQVLALPVPVSNSLTVNHSPAVEPLEHLVHELEPLGILLVDRQRARMFVFQFGELIERAELFEELPRDYDTRDEASRGSREREQHHTDELVAQHLRHSAEVAFRLLQDRGFAHFTVGGTDDVYAATVASLHPYLRERLTHRIHLGITASEKEVCVAALEIEKQLEIEKEAALVSRLRDSIGSHSKGVAGLVDTIEALNGRRVATLLVSDGFTESGWRCPSCGSLARKGPICKVDGAEMIHHDDVIHEVVDIALRTGCALEVCVGNADLDVLGRIGALLRY